jgi:hypothetical protein
MNKPYKFFKDLITTAYTATDIDVGTIQAYFYEEDNILYVTFASTNTVLDIYNHFFSIGYTLLNSKDKVHIGWYLAYSCIQEELYAKVFSKAYSKIVFVGHSYGAALACMAGYFFKDVKNIKIVVVAPPRCGNKKFVDKIIPFVSFAVYYGVDIIPFLPPWFKNVPLQHFGKRTFVEFIKNIILVIKSIIKNKKITYFDNTDFYKDHMPFNNYPDDLEIEL